VEDNFKPGHVVTMLRLVRGSDCNSTASEGTRASGLPDHWPSWIVYDQVFRQEMAVAKRQSWAKVDLFTYLVSFFSQNINAENWCSMCQSLDHTSVAWPARVPRKQAWPGMLPGGLRRPWQEICQKYN